MNIDRRIKKHIHGKKHTFFIVVPLGIEEITKQELKGLGFYNYQVETGGITLKGTLSDLYLWALHLKTATKILWRLHSCKVYFPEQIAEVVSQINWGYHLKPDTTITLNTTTQHARIYHTGLIESHFLKGINRYQDIPLNLKLGKNGISIHLRIVYNRLQISIDVTNPLLYKRGYKTASVPAPIRENLAAALLLKFWDQKQPLIDPMCGSGTFSFEGYMIQNGIPSGILRRFAFMDQPHFKERTYNYLLKKGIASHKQIKKNQHFTGDIDLKAIESVVANQKKLNIDLQPVVADFFCHKIDLREGFIILNPPYNKRLTYSKKAYRKMIDTLKKWYSGYSVLILHPSDRMLSGGVKPDQQFYFKNGGINMIASYFKHFPTT